MSGGYDSLDRKVAALEADVQNLNTAVSRLTTTIQNLADQLNKNSSTNWSVLAAWSAVIISILGGLGYLAMNPVQNKVFQIEHRFYDHLLSGGHSEIKIMIDGVEKRVEAIENEQRRRTDRVYTK